MSHAIVEFFTQNFEWLLEAPLGRELFSLIVSMVPIVELRGGIPVAVSLGLDPLTAFIWCFVGNILPVPFILWFITPVFDFMKKTELFRPLVSKIEAKATGKMDRVEKAEFWGLLLFVGIPLPGTGAWTGSLIAAMLGLNKKKALLAVTLGIILAGCLMLGLSLLAKGAFSF